MYNIGDRIVHPMHGAGVIADIEELEILGENGNITFSMCPAAESV